jgi:uncharacterized RDD family membrane protein YckC
MPWQNETSTASGRLLPPSLVFADTPSRATAYILDTLVFTAINSVSASIFGLYSFTVPNFPDRSAFVATTLVGFAFLFAYFVWFWSGGRRATPGQRVFGIQVGNAFDGQPLTLRQAVKRWLGFGMPIGLFALLPFAVVGIGAIIIGSLWSLLLLASTIASETKQGLHDRFAGSALVRPAGVGNRWAAGCLVIFLLFAVVEGLFGVWFVTNPTASSLPPDYWEMYLRWLWPS